MKRNPNGLAGPLATPINYRPLARKVTEAGGGVWSPASISPEWFYDPSDLSSLFSDTAGATPAVVDGPVRRMNDKSAHGRHVTNDTNPPTLKVDANGRYYLLTNGTTQFLSCAISGVSSYPLTLFAAAQHVTNQDGGVMSINASDSVYKALLKSATAGKYVATDRNASAFSATGSAAQPDYAPDVLEAQFTAAQASLFDGVAPAVNAANTNAFGSPSTLFIGKVRPAGLFFSGRFYGGVGVNRELTSDERLNLYLYLQRKSGRVEGFAAWGDSMTVGIRAGVTLAYPNQLAIAKSRYAYNYGVSGETSAQIASRFVAGDVRVKHMTQLLWMGTNDNWAANGWGPTKEAIASCVAGVRGAGRYLVLGATRSEVTSTTGAALDLLDVDLAALYGDRFLNVRAYLQSNHDGSANDLADIDAGLVPRSLRIDNVHLNDVGIQHVADCVAAKISSLGW